jgi:hypothetical protein
MVFGRLVAIALVITELALEAGESWELNEASRADAIVVLLACLDVLKTAREIEDINEGKLSGEGKQKAQWKI